MTARGISIVNLSPARGQVGQRSKLSSPTACRNKRFGGGPIISRRKLPGGAVTAPSNPDHNVSSSYVRGASGIGFRGEIGREYSHCGEVGCVLKRQTFAS